MLKYKTSKLTCKPCRSCIWPVMILPGLCMWISMSMDKIKQAWFSEPCKLLNCDYRVQFRYVQVSLYFFLPYISQFYENYVVQQDGICSWIIVTLKLVTFDSQDLYSTVLMVYPLCTHKYMWFVLSQYTYLFILAGVIISDEDLSRFLGHPWCSTSGDCLQVNYAVVSSWLP